MWVFNIAYYMRFLPPWSFAMGLQNPSLSIMIDRRIILHLYIAILYKLQVASQKVVLSERDRRQNHKSIR
jgi:hypothetical protein